MKVEIPHKIIKENLINTANLISCYYKELNTIPLVIPILKGGIFFFVDLVRSMKVDTEMGLISTNHYGAAETPFPYVRFRYQDADVSDRYVLVVDEICFTGKTLQYAKEKLLKEGAKEVKTVSLVNHIRGNRVCKPDWYVVTYKGTEWVYGYGMDRNGLHREKMDILS